MKTKRQNVIMDIISTVDVETQHQLLAELKKRGINATQATLSRDTKELHLVKEMRNGRYRYTLPERAVDAEYSERLSTIFNRSVVSCETAMNLIVLKTLPGLAMAASSALDGMDIASLVGTVAGDDTVFIAMRDVKSAESLCEEIKQLF